MNFENELDRTAIHEAGHAVFALLLGVKFKWVTIIPDKKGKYLGRCYPNLSLKTEGLKRSVIEKKILYLFTGEAAEAIATGKEHGNGFLKDWHYCTRLVAGLYKKNSTQNKYLMKFIAKAKEKVNSKWVIVEAVANELLEKKTLDKQEVLQIIEKFTPKL